jgi:hypothetical protein
LQLPKKIFPAPFVPDKHGSSPKVSGVRRHDRQPSRVACGDLVVQTIIAAELRTNGARAKHRLELLDALVEFILR